MHPLVSVEWLHDHQDHPDLIILDASIKKAVQTSDGAPETQQRIPRTRFFDLKGTFFDTASDLPNMLPDPEHFSTGCRELGINQDSTIIVYDTLGVYSSPRVWWMFKAMGHASVAVLNGGLPAWIDSGYDTEAITNEVHHLGNFQAHYRPNLVKNGKDIFQNITSKEAIVLDARSHGRFIGVAPEPRKGLNGGHIPDSLNLPFTDIVKDGHLLPKEELSTIIGKLELGNRPLIFTCGSGITACIIMLACELVTDNPKAVYDASWSEWGIPERDYPIQHE